jgi:3',5'-cyclic-nucleotide phosphodiesterase
VELRVIGCHGGETPKHRTSAFLVDDILAIDAGSLTSGLEIADQLKLEAALVSHAHLDHVRDLATIADTRCQLRAKPLVVGGTPETIAALKKHFFNNVLWPDFSQIPTDGGPTLRFVEMPPEEHVRIGRYNVRAVTVSHTIDSAGFVVESEGEGAIAYSGDTGPTDRFWQVLDALPDLRALLMEVSFPDREARLATVSGHHTPATLAVDLRKYKAPRDLPTMLYHIKPVFQAEVERECAALAGLNLHVLGLGDHFVL